MPNETWIVDLIQKVSTGGFVSILVLIIYGNYKGHWVWGWQLRKAEALAEKWEAMFWQTNKHADKGLDAAVAGLGIVKQVTEGSGR